MNNNCEEKKNTPSGHGLTLVVVLYILLVVILGSFKSF